MVDFSNVCALCLCVKNMNSVIIYTYSILIWNIISGWLFSAILYSEVCCFAQLTLNRIYDNDLMLIPNYMRQSNSRCFVIISSKSTQMKHFVAHNNKFLMCV